ncbi:hypothetical protein SAMN05192545_3953 [Maribacter dokdonensis]|uniref:Uncharacterized protein n=1 Tax=Maribacter dokdonensis TaxID=320912 RepID=A0ABY0V0L6_9FLAO|nr:hypothetical protein [Maribacter dokdonensis]SDT46609.1 hypothetical protein SAMN05192545_3901 [Maribacter dokdonensis]SDT47898.1 hypothetical protein SAMN05192545_3953 [Maribacter dokdonensis]
MKKKQLKQYKKAAKFAALFWGESTKPGKLNGLVFDYPSPVTGIKSVVMEVDDKEFYVQKSGQTIKVIKLT